MMETQRPEGTKQTAGALMALQTSLYQQTHITGKEQSHTMHDWLLTFSKSKEREVVSPTYVFLHPPGALVRAPAGGYRRTHPCSVVVLTQDRRAPLLSGVLTWWAGGPWCCLFP